MKTDLKTLKDSVKISFTAFKTSRDEEKIVSDFYHNRHYSPAQLEKLKQRGQPEETYNVVKLFARLLVGYYSTVVNTVKVNPTQQSDVLTARLLHDVVQYTFEKNHFETEGDKVKLDGMLSGLMCVFVDVVDSGKKDTYGRSIKRVEISHVPSREILLDPMSRKEDYSDARYMHRFKWVSEDYLKDFLTQEHSKKKATAIIGRLEAYSNHLNESSAEFTAYHEERFTGVYKQYDNYLLVHSIIVDDNKKTWSIFWCGEEEISRKEVTYRDVKFPYRIHRIHTSDKTEYYGLFREIVESQKAINQALIKIQLMVNSEKVFVKESDVTNLAEFTAAMNRVNAIIPVKNLHGFKIERLHKDILQQYSIIDKALERIQKVLGINDSFLGMAYASDSGRKVKLQQNATTLALRYVTTKIEQLYRLVGWDIVNLVKQYYTANEVLNITDEVTGTRWVELNKPLRLFTGDMDEQGNPVMKTQFEEVTDPATREPVVDDDGNLIIAPIPEKDTEIQFSEVDISIDTTAHDDEDEKNQLMIENVIQGTMGQALLQVNPAGYFQVVSLSIKNLRTKNSNTISEIYEQTAAMLGNQNTVDVPQSKNPKSSELKLPQNTNEGY